MANTIATSTIQYATGANGSPLVGFAPSDGSAIVIYHSGSGPTLATAQSPYTTWSTALIGGATDRNCSALLVHSDDSVDAFVGSPSSGQYWFHYTRSGNTWVQGSSGAMQTYVGNTGIGSNPAMAFAGTDPQGRIWAGVLDDINPTYQYALVYTAATYNGWFASPNPYPISLGETNRRGAQAAVVGNYLVLVYDAGAGGLKYQRLDVSGASLGAWSTAASIAGVSGITTSTNIAFKAIPGGSTAILAYDGGGISALKYDSSTDTWSSVTSLSAAANDTLPSLIPASSGNIVCAWSQYAAANSYALVYKKFNGSAWDASVTTLETSGTNQQWINGAYLASGSKLGYIWTQGTASPYNTQWNTASISFTNGGTRTVSASAALQATLTRQVTASAALQGANSRQVTASAALQGANSRHVSASVALLATSARQVTASATLAGVVNILTPNQSNVETDTSGFFPGGGVTLTRDTATFQQGAASLKVVTDSTGGRTFQQIEVHRTVGAYQAGQQYTFSAYMMASAGAPTLRFYCQTDQGSIGSVGNITLSTAWTRYTVTVTLPADLTPYKWIGLRADTGGTAQSITFWMDSLQVEQAASANPWVVGTGSTAAGSGAFSSQWRPVSSSAAIGTYRQVPTSAALGAFTRQVLTSAALGNVRAVPASAALWGRIPAMPIISQGVPSYAGPANAYAASNANDTNYATGWRSVDVPETNNPAYVALDLSGVPVGNRGSVVLNWMNELGTEYWTPGNQNANALPSAYTIDASPAPGGSLPVGGWDTLVTIPANQSYISRQHTINLTGYNWVRMRVTMASGQGINQDVSFQLDVHDASKGAQDYWFFFGDSITYESQGHHNIDNTPWGYGGALAQKVSTLTGGRYYPLTVDGGQAGMTMAWAAANMTSAFASGVAAKYVVIAFGTNDTNLTFDWSAGDANVRAVYNNLLTVIDYVSALPQAPTVVVPYIPWGSNNSGHYANNANLVNQYVDAHLPADRPAALRGPNFYSLFQANPTLIRDGIHPTYTETNGQPSGYELMQQTWAQWMGATVYQTPTRQVAASASLAYAYTRNVPADAAISVILLRRVLSSTALATPPVLTAHTPLVFKFPGGPNAPLTLTIDE